MGQPKINLCIDIISPFGWLAFYVLRHSPTFSPCALTLTPILLGALHKQCGITAPIFLKNKDKWINAERTRWADAFNIPMRREMPAVFPFSTVNAMRAVVAMQADESKFSAEEVARVVEVLGSAVWDVEGDAVRDVQGLRGGGGKGEFDVKSEKGLVGLIGSVVGRERAEGVVGRIGEKEVKDALVRNTNVAFERGAFGIPWLECTDGEGRVEGFWGFDHLGQVVRFLGLDGGKEEERSGRALKALL